MVCGLTTVGRSREKYAEYQEFVLASQKKALDLKARFMDVMDRDTEAFNVVSAAFGMPRHGRGEGRPLCCHSEGAGGMYAYSL